MSFALIQTPNPTDDEGTWLCDGTVIVPYTNLFANNLKLTTIGLVYDECVVFYSSNLLPNFIETDQVDGIDASYPYFFLTPDDEEIDPSTLHRIVCSPENAIFCGYNENAIYLNNNFEDTLIMDTFTSLQTVAFLSQHSLVITEGVSFTSLSIVDIVKGTRTSSILKKFMSISNCAMYGERLVYYTSHENTLSLYDERCADTVSEVVVVEDGRGFPEIGALDVRGNCISLYTGGWVSGKTTRSHSYTGTSVYVFDIRAPSSPILHIGQAYCSMNPPCVRIPLGKSDIKFLSDDSILYGYVENEWIDCPVDGDEEYGFWRTFTGFVCCNLLGKVLCEYSEFVEEDTHSVSINDELRIDVCCQFSLDARDPPNYCVLDTDTKRRLLVLFVKFHT